MMFGAEVVADPGLAATLQSYGGWGLSAILMSVIVYLFFALQRARDSKEGTLEAQVKSATQIIEETTKSSVQLNGALINLTDAMKSMDRRLENVEDKLGR